MNTTATTGTEYVIAEDGRSITCLCCGLTSHNPNDVAYRYCGGCHRFMGDDIASLGKSEKSFQKKLDIEFTAVYD